MKFSDASSICRAALYMDAYDDAEGGEVYITLGEDETEYGSDTKNGI